jgi:hypothetical protein
MSRRALFFLSVFFVLSLVLIAQNSVKGDSGFVGSEVCKDCHDAYYNKFMKSIHGKKAIPGAPINRDRCESCHGPGAQHVEKGGGRSVAIFGFDRQTQVRGIQNVSHAMDEQEIYHAPIFENIFK